MTDITIVQPGWGLDVVFLDQSPAKAFLILIWLVTHRKYLLSRTHILLRMAMAVQAPCHVKRVRFPGKRHLVDSPMTGFTTDSLGHMNTVIEVNIIWQVIHPIPLDRLTGAKAFPYGFKHGTLAPDLTVTGHAGFRWREIGKGRCLHRLMAVSAINAVINHVMLMAERDRLLNRIVYSIGKR